MKNLIKIMLLSIMAVFIMPPAYAADQPETEKTIVSEPQEEVKFIAQLVDTQLQHEHVTVPNIQVPVNTATMNPVDYGLVGTMAIGIMGLLTYMIRADRTDRAKMVEAVENLRTSIEAQKQSTDKLSSEIHSMVLSMERRLQQFENSMEQRLDEMEDTVKSIESAIGKQV